MEPSRVVVLAGGVGGARFVRGLRAHLAGSAEITVVANTGDDMWLAGLRITPDLDSILYALAGVNDTERGWGRAGETERVAAELTAFGVGWPWFTLGDLDLGTHIARTALLREGLPLSAVTARLAARWPIGVRLLPATD
jgi:LPPG:FO 2-phospho-L-lactate transferase